LFRNQGFQQAHVGYHYVHKYEAPPLA